MNCETFHDYVVQCGTTLQVNALLEPATQYKWVITNRIDKQYEGFATSNGSGFIAIPIADLPDGLLNQYGGEFKLEIYNPSDLCRPINFKMARFYDAICFEVKAGTNEKNNLGCDFDCNATSGTGNSGVVPFTAIASLHLTWTSLLNSLYGSAPTIQVYSETSPNVYELVSVSIILNHSGYTLDSIDVDFGGLMTGYILIN